ncbi:MAG: serine hydrolase [Myxococcales bacterium]|nr:serine hydrolase [Myxococcales bacterium]
MRRAEAALALAALGAAACFPSAEPPQTPAPAAPPTATPAPGAAPGPTAPLPPLPAATPSAAPIPTLAPPPPRPSASQIPPTPQPAPAGPARPTAEAPRVTTGGVDASMGALLSGGGAALKQVVAAPEKHRFQVLYSKVLEGTPPRLERHGHRVDAEYFFPASAMKMPIALALVDQWGVRRGAQPGLQRDATMRIHPSSGAGEPYVTTLSREIWRALIVSDNASANRLLGVVGHREAHETLWALGLGSTRIHSGFSTGGEIDPATVSPRVELAGAGGAAELPARKSDLALPPTDAKALDVGKAYIDGSGRRVDAPLSFAAKNAIHLTELQDALVRVVRPDLVAPGAAPDAASKEDLAYVRQALGTLPSESGLAGFARNVVADYQYVPYLRGIERVRPRGRFQVFAKVGQAFGFLVVNAYVVDKDTGRSFFLLASVYANPDETMNDDVYAYESVSAPAMADLAEAACRDAFGAP